ncbi:hypothetical protein GTP41_05510 [Pseudoduganella sp. DS3]|uniref:Uncharacterized protein n=1 Tax=Pseudoduganella guangdongensis TaxID=2692179 RepID=A0A6N9HDP6_9BURK|nr:hypothetical protein [Pseudoduganella guangdongensis]MYN01550.1 hypothetical protein [Pseudoduganella guangdongensis]
MKFTLDRDLLLSTYLPSSEIDAEARMIFNTIDKRKDFSELHYYEFINCFGEDGHLLEMERDGIVFTDAGKRHNNRVHYEANIFAFVQNLHALCDSFPFVTLRVLGPLEYSGKKGRMPLTKKQCGWNDVFFKSVEETHPQLTEFLGQIRRFGSEKTFLLLRGLVNQCKHQYLPRILNHRTSLHFDVIEYTDASGNQVRAENLDAEALMRKWHNRLLRRLFLLYVRLHRARLKQLSLTS